MAGSQGLRLSGRRTAGPCPLRSAEVVSSSAEGARLAAVVSLALVEALLRVLRLLLRRLLLV